MPTMLAWIVRFSVFPKLSQDPELFFIETLTFKVYVCLRGRPSQPPHGPLLPRQRQRRRPCLGLPPSPSAAAAALRRGGEARVAPASLLLKQTSHHCSALAAPCRGRHIEVFNLWESLPPPPHRVHIFHVFSSCQCTPPLVSNDISPRQCQIATFRKHADKVR